jgi:hypothetical protein
VRADAIEALALAALCNRRLPICKKDLHQQESIIDLRKSIFAEQFFVTNRRAAITDFTS